MNRRDIYYWKCDRPAAFHGTAIRNGMDAGIEAELLWVLRRRFDTGDIVLSAGSGQGNHLTWNATIAGRKMFVRVEDGPERDDYIEVESQVMRKVAALGIPVPTVHAVDASRSEVPFAWQVMDRVPCPDLNQLLKEDQLELPVIATQIGAALARWQSIEPEGFGPFDVEGVRASGTLRGYHSTYADYFHLRLDEHLNKLEQKGFLSREDTAGFRTEIRVHGALLGLEHGCLVHKDLALWNILGTRNEIAAVIDWDDAISGDPMDDLSLLGCFHDGAMLSNVIAGYASRRSLPSEHRRRFWLHLLRNMIVKSVIRVGAGYFERTDKFFLIPSGGTGEDLRRFTLQRLRAALTGLREDRPIEHIDSI